MRSFYSGIAILTAVIIWGLSFPLIKILLNQNVPPIIIAMLRHLIFLPMILIVFLSKNSSHVLFYSKKTWGMFILLGVFTIFLPNVAQNIGMLYTTASTSSIIQSSAPIFTIILAWVFLKESKNLHKIAGSIVAMTGVILLVSGGNLGFSGTTYGNLLILVSCLSYAVSGIILKKGLTTIPPLHLLCFETIFGFILLLFTTIFYEDISIILSFDVYTWFIIIMLAVFASGVAVILYYAVLVDTELSQLIVFVYLIPLFATVFSYLLLGEIITLETAVFAILIVGGVAVAQKSRILSKST
ncbi:MAG TPA: DMT family transporter [Thermoplasmata archaeon]|nr:DMT family transporter [Thermoplasmata archaeon]